MLGAVLAGIHDLPLFVGAGLLLNLTPGADVALIAARSTGQGLRSGAAAALGIGAGCGLHAVAAALGLSALVAGSPTAFAVLRWAGAAYLVWLGLGMVRSSARHGNAAAPAAAAASAGRVFAQGFLTNALNPKVVMFFLAFVPQFVRADAPQAAGSFALLGAIFTVNGTLVNLGFAALLAALRQRWGDGGRVGRWLGRGAGAVMVALGLKLAFGPRA
jgi:threonine/homoserine/homoserine lactone efflux protein